MHVVDEDNEENQENAYMSDQHSGPETMQMNMMMIRHINFMDSTFIVQMEFFVLAMELTIWFY